MAADSAGACDGNHAAATTAASACESAAAASVRKKPSLKKRLLRPQRQISNGRCRVSLLGGRARQLLLRAGWPRPRLSRRLRPTASFSASVTATVFPACVVAHTSEQGAGRRASGSATKRCRGELVSVCTRTDRIFTEGREPRRTDSIQRRAGAHTKKLWTKPRLVFNNYYYNRLGSSLCVATGKNYIMIILIQMCCTVKKKK